MARTRALILGLVLILALAAATPFAEARRTAGPAILVDLSHGEGTIGLCTLFAVMPEAHWAVLVPSEDYELPNCPVQPAEILVGDFAAIADRLKDFDMIIIGQPTKYLSDDEVKAIVEWFKGGSGKVLWCAGDSDYPAQGGNQEIAQHACNKLLEAIGSKLRLDYVSIEDTVSNAGRPYRVVGIVKPDARHGAEIVAMGASKVLFHGPGAVAWVDEQGNWHKLTEEGTPDNLVKLVVTTENGRVVEHQPKQPGAPGEFGKAHTVGETGVFVLMAAEVIPTENIPSVIIVSGETPYGGYQPMVTYRYHGVALDGPRFVRNLLLWALNYPAELAITPKINVEELAGKVREEVKSLVEEAKAAANEAKAVANEVKTAIEDLANTVKQLSDTVKTLGDNVETVSGSISGLQAAIANLQSLVYAALGVAVIALIAAIVAIIKR